MPGGRRTSSSHETVRTLFFLKLVAAGHLTIYITRNTGPLWQRPWPNWRLVVAAESPRVGLALAWLVVNDAVKVLVLRHVRHGHARARRHLERLSTEGADEAFGEHVHVRRMRRGPHDAGADTFDAKVDVLGDGLPEAGGAGPCNLADEMRPDRTLILRPDRAAWAAPGGGMGAMFLVAALDGFVTLTRRAGFHLGIALFFGFIAAFAGLLLLTAVHAFLDKVKLVRGDDGTVTVISYRWSLRPHLQVLQFGDIQDVIVEHDEGPNLVLLTADQRLLLTHRGDGSGDVDPKLVEEVRRFLDRA